MINVAVIGAGYWGPNLIRNLAQMKGAKLCAVCDIEQKNLDKIGSQYPGLKLTKNFNDIINDSSIEAVVIALPAALHYEFSKIALNNKKHVLVEKPITLDVASAQELVNIAEKNGRVLMVDSTFLYNSAVRKIKEYIKDGSLGDIQHIYFQRSNWGRIRKDINAMWNLAPHDVSMALYWLEEKPKMLYAHGQDYLQEGIEDMVYLDMEFEGKKTVHIYSSWMGPEKIRKAVIIGSKRKIVYDDMAKENKVQIYTTKTDENFSFFSEEVSIPQIEMSEPLFVECIHFIDCIENNKKPLSDGIEGLETVRVLEAAQKSLKSKKPVII